MAERFEIDQKEGIQPLALLQGVAGMALAATGMTLLADAAKPAPSQDIKNAPTPTMGA